MKISELQGAALDWAVAKCEGFCKGDFAWYYDRRDTFKYSTDWAQGGPIIEREIIRISDEPFKDGDECVFVAGGIGHWYASHSTWTHTNMQGQTPLIAAMRCYVASKLGEEVDVPKELI